MLSKNSIWKALIILSSLGILLAVYLFYNFLTKPLVESCYINATINCDAVTKGTLSTLFGIPVSLIGLIGYIVILLSSIFKQKLLVLGMSTFGMIFCLFITYQEVFRLKVICPVCLTCQLVMLTVFLLAIYLNFKKHK
jgi:Predicted membrane protein